MGSHPANLAIRFILEMAALVAMALWGWSQDQGALGLVAAVCVPAAAAATWGVFAVPGDPSRSGRAPVPVSGVLRLAIEAAFFAFAIWSLHSAGHGALSTIFGATVIGHYIASYDRVAWLLQA